MFARRRYNMLRALLDAVGMDPERVRLTFISASEGAQFAQTVKEFVEEIRALGPNPLKVREVREA